MVNHGRGAGEGFGLGGLVGGTVGAFAGTAAAAGFQNVMCGGSDRANNSCTNVGGLLAGAGLGFLITGLTGGLLIGLPIGAARGHRTTVEFDPPEQNR